MFVTLKFKVRKSILEGYYELIKVSFAFSGLRKSDSRVYFKSNFGYVKQNAYGVFSVSCAY